MGRALTGRADRIGSRNSVPLRCSACEMLRLVKTLGLSVLVALGTLFVMAVVGLAFFTSGGGVIFPAIVAWVTASLFAFTRRPRHLWLQVGAIGIFVAGLLNLYFTVLPRMFPPPPGYSTGGPNVLPPPGTVLPQPPP